MVRYCRQSPHTAMRYRERPFPRYCSILPCPSQQRGSVRPKPAFPRDAENVLIGRKLPFAFGACPSHGQFSSGNCPVLLRFNTAPPLDLALLWQKIWDKDSQWVQSVIHGRPAVVGAGDEHRLAIGSGSMACAISGAPGSQAAACDVFDLYCRLDRTW